MTTKRSVGIVEDQVPPTRAELRRQLAERMMHMDHAGKRECPPPSGIKPERKKVRSGYRAGSGKENYGK